MANFLKQSELKAQIATAQSLLQELPPEDFLGRLGLNSQINELIAEQGARDVGVDTLASTALYFGGRPVVGSRGIEAEFASMALFDFKDLVVKFWATSEAEVASRGPVPNQDLAKLHVTALLHGSVGFLIEEVDLKGTPLFATPLKSAAEKAVDLIVSIAKETEEEFERQLETLHPRVFTSVQRMFKDLHRAEASIRLVDQGGDRILSSRDVDHAFVRLEESSVEETTLEEYGLLLGLIPNGGRFEFRSEAGDYREGKVAPTLSEAYLHRIESEQGEGKWFSAKFSMKEARRFGRVRATYTLTDLVEAGGLPAGNLLGSR